MQGQDLRQTMVTIGLSIVIADLLMWVFGGAGAPDGARRTGCNGPIRGIPLINAYSAYRLACSPFGIVIGVGAVAVPQPHARRHDDPRRRR